jgi:hypothetical protein
MSTSDFSPDHRALPRIFANPKESQLAEITQLLFQSGSEGIVVPLPLIFGDTGLSRMLLRFNGLLVKLWPTMFSFQILLCAKARPNLATLLASAQQGATEKSSETENENCAA